MRKDATSHKWHRHDRCCYISCRNGGIKVSWCSWLSGQSNTLKVSG